MPQFVTYPPIIPQLVPYFHRKIRLAHHPMRWHEFPMSSDTEALRKSLHIYKGLVEVSGLINSITDFNDLLRAILDVARRVIQAEAASLFFVNEQTGHLDLAIASFSEGEFQKPQISVPPGRGIVGWVLEHGESLLIPDAYADSRFYQEADRRSGFHTRSILCAPLKRDGIVTGVLQVLNPRGRDAFDTQELEGFTAYANLIATAIEKLRTLEKSRAQERVERDLAIASDIQRELLAHALPSDLSGAAFAAHNEAASNVGGDFYNVCTRDKDRICFAIGDVSGKGIPASLLMAQMLSAMQFVFSTTTGPADALSRLNSSLCDRIIRGMFVTALVGRIDKKEGCVELASAGHCRPILLRADGTAAEIATEPALPLGILPEVPYRQTRFDLHKGDWLVCYTDGLSESRNPQSKDFFEEQILSTLHGTHFSSPRQIIDTLLAAELSHRGSGPQHDDLTIMAGGLL